MGSGRSGSQNFLPDPHTLSCPRNSWSKDMQGVSDGLSCFQEPELREHRENIPCLPTGSCRDQVETVKTSFIIISKCAVGWLEFLQRICLRLACVSMFLLHKRSKLITAI